MLNPLLKAINQAKNDPSRLLELQRFNLACINLGWINDTGHLFAVWSGTKGREQSDFDILEFLAKWMETKELIELVSEDPVPIQEDEAWEEQGLFTRRRIYSVLAHFDGVILGAERAVPGFLMLSINSAISQHMEEWTKLLGYSDSVFYEDTEAQSSVFELRSKLEYALSAMAIFQMEVPGRLEWFRIPAFMQWLCSYDLALKDVHRRARTAKWNLRNPLAPPSFWWEQ